MGKQRYMTIILGIKSLGKLTSIPSVWRFLMPMSILKNLMLFTARNVPNLDKSNIADLFDDENFISI